MIRPKPSWTDERIGHLRELAKARYSATEIGTRLGVSRNAVIGKMSRLGIALYHNREWQIANRKAAPRRLPANHSAKSLTPQRVTIRPRRHGSAGPPVQILLAKEIIDLPPDQSSFACTLMELGHNQCRYVLGQATADALFCAAPADGSWCQRHDAIVFTRKMV